MFGNRPLNRPTLHRTATEFSFSVRKSTSTSLNSVQLSKTTLRNARPMPLTYLCSVYAVADSVNDSWQLFCRQNPRLHRQSEPNSWSYKNEKLTKECFDEENCYCAQQFFVCAILKGKKSVFKIKLKWCVNSRKKSICCVGNEILTQKQNKGQLILSLLTKSQINGQIFKFQKSWL